MYPFLYGHSIAGVRPSKRLRKMLSVETVIGYNPTVPPHDVQGFSPFSVFLDPDSALITYHRTRSWTVG